VRVKQLIRNYIFHLKLGNRFNPVSLQKSNPNEEPERLISSVLEIISDQLERGKMADPYMNLEPADFFSLLESNKVSVVEDIKCLIHDHLNVTKEAWLVHGLYDYSMAKGSQRATEILLGLREPHAKHLFDKVLSSISPPNVDTFLIQKKKNWNSQ